MIEIFAPVTGVAFLLSAITQAVILSVSNVDFFAVASLEDIVTGGVRLLILSAIIAPSALVASAVIVVLISDVDLAQRSNRWKRFLIMRFLIVPLLLVLGAIIIDVLFWYYIAFIKEIGEFKVRLIYAIIFSTFVSMFLILTGSLTIKQTFAHMRREWKPLVTAFCVMLAITVPMTSTIGYTNMYAGPAAVLPTPCRSEHSGHGVVWIGSRSVILKCGRNFYVIRNEPPLVFAVAAPRLSVQAAEEDERLLLAR